MEKSQISGSQSMWPLAMSSLQQLAAAILKDLTPDTPYRQLRENMMWVKLNNPNPMLDLGILFYQFSFNFLVHCWEKHQITTMVLLNPQRQFLMWIDIPKTGAKHAFEQYFPAIKFNSINESVSGALELQLTEGSDALHFNRLESYFFYPPQKRNFSTGLIHQQWVTLLGLESDVAPKGEAIRMVYAEWERVSTHLQQLAGIFYALGFIYRGRQLQLAHHHVHEFLGPVYNLPAAYVLGGVDESLTDLKIYRARNLAQQIERLLALTRRKLITSPIAKSRLKNWKLSIDRLLSLSSSGVLLRACGMRYDHRFLNPYAFYHECEFEIPLGDEGSGWCVCMNLLEEIKQSLKILSQMYENMPFGKCRIPGAQKLMVKQEQCVFVESPAGEMIHFYVNNDVYFKDPRSYHHFAINFLLQKGDFSCEEAHLGVRLFGQFNLPQKVYLSEVAPTTA